MEPHVDMGKKYIMALVHLPIEIMPNGSCEPMTNRIHISFEPCELLPKQTNPTETSVFAVQLREILASFTNQPQVARPTENIVTHIPNSSEEINKDRNSNIVVTPAAQMCKPVNLENEEEHDLDIDNEENSTGDSKESNSSMVYVLQSEMKKHNRKIKETFDITFKKREKPTYRHTAKLR